MRITINEGSAFLISDENGDVAEHTEAGFYYKDTRFLSSYELLIDGHSPIHLSSKKINYYVARHYLTNPLIKDPSESKFFLRPEVLSLTRTHIVANGLHEDLDIQNFSDQAITFDLTFKYRGDFADIFEVKRGEISKSGTVKSSADEDQQWILHRYSHEGYMRWLGIKFEMPYVVKEFTPERATFEIRLEPRETFHTCTIIYAGADELEPVVPSYTCFSFEVLEMMHKDLSEEWLATAPRVGGDSLALNAAHTESVKAMAALRLKDKEIDPDVLIPAAGIPWFVTFFGRDSLIASFQTIMNRRELAQGTLRTLARYQGKEENDFRDEEPGKILHEIRFGELASLGEIPHTPYYGTVDATPLFVILLSEFFDWTGDLAFVKEHEPNLRAALTWIDKHGDMDGDGYIEYSRRGSRGLENQGWKDSFDAIQFKDCKLAEGPVALSEVQGYVYDCWTRAARLLSALGDTTLSSALSDKAAALKANFNMDFWLEEEEYFALALDGEKRKVNSIASNAGHLLWSGIVESEKQTKLASRLLAPDMFSGWGVRTLSAEMRGYNPISYHNGSVWPHDNSLIAWGLRRSGFDKEAMAIVNAMIEASSHFEPQVLPELFCGFKRTRRSFPVEYPKSSSPQAWAAGAIPLFIRTMLGLNVDAQKNEILLSPVLPDDMNILTVHKIPVFDGELSLHIERHGELTSTEILEKPQSARVHL